MEILEDPEAEVDAALEAAADVNPAQVQVINPEPVAEADDLDMSSRESGQDPAHQPVPVVPVGRGQLFATEKNTRWGFSPKARTEVREAYSRHARINELPVLDQYVIKRFFPSWPANPKYPGEKNRAAFHYKYKGLLRELDLCIMYKDIQDMIKPSLDILDNIEGIPKPLRAVINQKVKDTIQWGCDKLTLVNLARRRNIFTSNVQLAEHEHMLRDMTLFCEEELRVSLFGNTFINAFRAEIHKNHQLKDGLKRAPALRTPAQTGYQGYVHENDIHFMPFKLAMQSLLESMDLPRVEIPINFQTLPSINMLGGRIAYFIKNWELVTESEQILSMVKGHKIHFWENPPKNASFKRSHSNKEEVVIKDLLSKGIIEPAPEVGYVSNIFLVPKSNGEYRLILNLSSLNEYVSYSHFKMQSIKDAMLLIRVGDYFVKIDLRKAYDCCRIHKNFRKFLQFFCNSVLYQFIGWPNGLCECPRLFTKLLKPILAILGRLGYRFVSYLDDMLLCHQDPLRLRLQVSLVVQLFTALGFVINTEKSIFVPTQVIEFLGFTLDSTNMTISLPTLKQEKIVKRCSALRQSITLTKRELASIIGLLNSASLAVTPGTLFLRGLQTLLISVPNLDWDCKLSLSQEALKDLLWWSTEMVHWTSSVFPRPVPTLTLTTDSSDKGWGATLEHLSTKQQWKPSQLKLHINTKELLAIQLGLKKLLPSVRNTCIRVLSDNTTALAYINKMGGTKVPELNRIATEIWLDMLARGNYLVTKHVPGILNTEADALSRNLAEPGDWRLSPALFKKIDRLRGPLRVDLFAAKWNAQTERFISWHFHPLAQGQDALSLQWEKKGGYAFPPFSLLPRVLNIIRRQKVTVVVVTPLWPSAIWYGDLIQMSINYPILLPACPDLLTNQVGAPHPLLPQMRLVAWTLSGNSTSVKEFQAGQQRLSPMRRSLARNVDIATVSINSSSGAGPEVSLPFTRL